MNVFARLFGKKQPTSSAVAKERLQLVLIHDRVKLSPEILQRIRDDLVAVMSKYLDIDRDGLQITLTQNKRLIVDMPVRDRSARKRSG
jgi:cell division topological specificity factor